MKLVICGGGISGLTAAYYASKILSKSSTNFFKIVVVEKSKNVGGWMKTNVANGDRKVYNGPINEQGPRSVRRAGMVGNNTLQLVSELGLEDEIIPVRSEDIAAKKRLIYLHGQLFELPSGFLGVCQKQKPFSESLIKSMTYGYFKKVPSNYETMHEVCCERFGNEVGNYLISAFTRGVFAADSRHLSMKAAFPDMWKMFKPKEASLPRKPSARNPGLLNKTLLTNPFIKRAKQEKWTQWGVAKGFHYFTESLAKYLVENMNVEILRDTEIDRITLKEDGKIKVKTKTNEENLPWDDEIDNVDHLVSALPSYSLSQILRRTTSAVQDRDHKLNVLGMMLSHIRWVNVAVSNIEFDGSPDQVLPTIGFGHLVPVMEPSNVMGVVYDSCAFPQHDRLGVPSTRLTCMLGGSWFKELFGEPEQAKINTIEQAALESIAGQLKITKDPVEMHTTKCIKCIPMYGVGHTDLVEQAEDYIVENQLPISLVGSSYWGVSVNDCIFNSRLAVYKTLRERGLVL